MKTRCFKLFIFVLVCVLASVYGSILAFAATPADENFDIYTNTTGNSNIYVAGLLSFQNTGNSAYVGVTGCGDFNGISIPYYFDSNVLSNDYLINGTATSFKFSSTNSANDYRLNSFVSAVYTGLGGANVVNITGYNNDTKAIEVTGINLAAENSYYNTNVNDTVSVKCLVNDPANGIYIAKLSFGSNWTDIDTVEIKPNGSQYLLMALDSLDFSDVLNISVDDVTVDDESAGTAAFTISLSQTYGSDITVDYATAINTATAGDFASTSGSAKILAGNMSTTVSVPITDDAIDEENESFYLNISNPSVGGITDAQGVCTIIDNDDPPTVSISDASVTERDIGTANLVYTVTLSQESGKTVKVNYETQDGTATTADNDYAAATGTLTFAPGETSKTITVTVKCDTTQEPDETVLVNLTSPFNVTIGDSQGTAIITNDDIPSISINDVSISEGNSGSTSMNFTVSLSSSSNDTITVNYAISPGTAEAGTDYISGSNTITFTPGQTTQAITVVINCDLIDEEDETLFVNLSGATNGIDITDAQGIGTITNDDLAPTITISNATVTEGNSGTVNVIFTVILSAASGKTITVNCETQDGTATVANNDYTAKTATTLTFTPGEINKTITVQVLGDVIDEDNENFQVILSGASNATILISSALGIIADDDAAPGISISAPSVTEGDAGTANLVYTVTLSQESGKTVKVNYETQDGTATTADNDYAAATGTLTFAPGETCKTITVMVKCDTTQEPDETVFVNLTNPINATIIDNHGTGTIINDDTPSLSIADATIAEGNSGTKNMNFTVTLSKPSTSTVTVNYFTLQYTAFAGTDYIGVSSTLTFTPGQTTQDITVVINGDLIDEEDEKFYVNLSDATYGIDITDSQGIGTITDDDASPSLSINDVEITEGNSGNASALFTVSLSAVSGKTITVNYETQDGTATAADYDYTAKTATTLTFAPGETSETIAVYVSGDTIYENDENFIVNLSGASNATIADSSGSATIKNDDSAPTVSLSSDKTTISESSGIDEIEVTATLSNKSYQDVTVEFDFTGTAVNGSDYSVVPGSSPVTIIIPAGSLSGIVTITVINDATYEGDEPFSVTISSVTNGAEDGEQKVDLTVIDNETIPSVTLSVEPADFSENAGAAAITATLSNKSYQDVTVYLAFTGTAAPADYSASSDTITIPAGSLSCTKNLTAINNSVYSGNRTIIVDITGVTNGTEKNGTQQVTATIIEDDPIPDITQASVTITSPVPGATPQDAAAVQTATNHSDYTVTGLIWNEPLTASGKFKAAQVYTATVTLTSKNNKKFQDAVFTPAVAGSQSVGTTTKSGGAVVGNTVSFTVTFAATDALKLESIAVTTQPAKLSYSERTDAKLALNGMKVTETYNDGSTNVVTFTDGTATGYTTSPANGTTLTNASYNRKPVVITHTASGKTASTDIITVAVAAIPGSGGLIINISPVTPAPVITIAEVKSELFSNADDIKVEADIDSAFGQSVELKITDSTESQNEIFSLAGANNEVYPFDISLYSMTSGEKVQPKYGYSVKITLPVPEKLLEDKEKIKVVYARDGKLETLKSELIEKNGKWYIIFEAVHFSPYAFIVNAEPETNPSKNEQTWINPFSDVQEGSWYYSAVQYVAQNGLMLGTDSNTFSPAIITSRGMIATILYRLNGTYETSESSFNDVIPGAYYSKAVAWAQKNGIIAGYGNGMFGPEDSITREQMITILWRYAGSPAADSAVLADFKDTVEISQYSKIALAWACKEGIITGRGNGILDPKGLATRAEVAQMIQTFFQKVYK